MILTTESAKYAAHSFKLNRQTVGLVCTYRQKLVGDRRRNLQGFGGGDFFHPKKKALPVSASSA